MVLLVWGTDVQVDGVHQSSTTAAVLLQFLISTTSCFFFFSFFFCSDKRRSIFIPTVRHLRKFFISAIYFKPFLFISKYIKNHITTILQYGTNHSLSLQCLYLNKNTDMRNNNMICNIYNGFCFSVSLFCRIGDSYNQTFFV